MSTAPETFAQREALQVLPFGSLTVIAGASPSQVKDTLPETSFICFPCILYFTICGLAGCTVGDETNVGEGYAAVVGGDIGIEGPDGIAEGG